MDAKIKVGISTCLLGEKVRYDGNSKRDSYLVDVIGPFVEWVPVCPEVECGLPIPREAMRLIGNSDALCLVTIKTQKDITPQMDRWLGGKLGQLESESLCGFVFKTKSPSSAMRDAKIYSSKGVPSQKGPGIFARAFMARFPNLPVEDEGRLQDAGLRENFIERIFVLHRWQQLTRDQVRPKDLIEFHTKHKYLIMAHSPQKLSELGRLVAHVKPESLKAALSDYQQLLMETLKLKATVKKQVNVLHHLIGYFKRVLTFDEKQELLEVIDQYHRELVPLIVPITLISHYVRKYNDSYLKEQVYLHPHPIELMLRNHV